MNTPTTSLENTRAIERPTREEMLARAPSVQRFWDENAALFENAWKEWENSEGQELPLDESIFAPKLRAAVEQAWEDPSSEIAVKDLWEEVFPGVYAVQFFDPERISMLRGYLDNIDQANIPLRPPYGISLNRGGAMLDPRSEGHLAAPRFQAIYRSLMDKYMRPVSRLLFPDIVGYDSQTFGFSIRWQENKDTSLRPHTDASSVTLNINLNLPGEDFGGSAVSFYDQETRQKSKLTFKPGTALIHHGTVMHASEPITSGERYNFVLWLYGEHGQIPFPGSAAKEIEPRERWSVPKTASDGFAPF